MSRPGDFLARCRLAGYIFKRAGFSGLRQALAYARASKTRERNYQTYLRDFEPGLLAAESAAPFPTGANPPHIGILTPLYNTPPAMLHRCIQSVRAQTYDRWTLCLIDDASTHPDVAALARSYADIDPRIRFTQLKKNSGISAATNAALALAVESGCDFIALLDHDDELSPHALRALARRIAAGPPVDLLYTDEDKIASPDSSRSVKHNTNADDFLPPPPAHRHTPTFKPGFSPHLLLSHNYICHLLCIRTRLIKEVGGFRTEYDGAQDYDLILRLLLHVPSSRIAHIPLILYHWRTHPSSTSFSPAAKPWAIDAGRRALADHLTQLTSPSAVERHPFRPTFKLRFSPPSSPSLLPPLLPPILRSRTADPAALRAELRAFARQHPDAPFLACLHPDLTPPPRSPDWLQVLQHYALLPHPYTSDLIAPRLISHSRPRRTLSSGFFHAENSAALTNPFADLPLTDPGPNWRLTAPFNADVVSPLCFLIRAETLSVMTRQPLRSVIIPEVCINVPDDLVDTAREAKFTVQVQ